MPAAAGRADDRRNGRLATIDPDFETVEQKVANIGFSDTQQFVSDRRRQSLASAVTNQFVLTPQYRLTSERSIGGRIVVQDGEADIFAVYAQKARTGSDISVLLGDPNSPTTRVLLQCEVATPF